MDKLQLTGQTLGRVFNSRSGCEYSSNSSAIITKLPNLLLKTWPKQLLGHLPLAFVLPVLSLQSAISHPQMYLAPLPPFTDNKFVPVDESSRRLSGVEPSSIHFNTNKWFFRTFVYPSSQWPPLEKSKSLKLEPSQSINDPWDQSFKEW